MKAAPTPKAKLIFLAGALPFLMSLLLLGYAVNTGLLLKFAIAWPLFQLFGYYMTLNLAKGDVTHGLVVSQVALHYMVLALLGAILAKAL